MACMFRSLMHSAKYGGSMMNVYIWILVICIPASSFTETVATDTKMTYTVAERDPDQDVDSAHADSGVFIPRAAYDAHLTMSVLSKSATLDSTANQLSHRLTLKPNVDLTPSFGILGEHLLSKRFEQDINSHTLSSETATPRIEIKMLSESNSVDIVPQIMAPKEQRFSLGNTQNDTVSSVANLVVDSRINGTSSQNDSYHASNELKSFVFTTIGKYFFSDSISSSLTATPRAEYSPISTVLDSVGSRRNVISNAQEVSLSHTSGTSPSYNRNNVGPSLSLSLANTPTRSAYIVSNTATFPLTKTSDQIFSAVHSNETYISSEKPKESSVDASLEPVFTSDFDSNILSSSLAQLFSDLTIYPSGHYQNTTPSTSAGYFPLSSTELYNLLNETSDWRPTTLLPGPPSSMNASASPHPSENVVGSTVILDWSSSTVILDAPSSLTVILDSASSSTTSFYYQQQSADTKEWAVPVTVCLSVALLITVVVVIVTCCRSKSAHVSQRHYRDRDDIAVGDTRQEQRQTGNATVVSKPAVPPRYKQRINMAVGDKPRDDWRSNVGQRDVLKGNNAGTMSNSPTGALAERDMFEMDKISPSARENVYTQHNTQSGQEEYYRTNEEICYDDPTFLHGSPDSRHGFSERIKNSPKSGNRLGTYNDGTEYTFNKTPQIEFETSKMSNQMSRDGFKIKTRNVFGNEKYAPTSDNSDSRGTYNCSAHNRQDVRESAQKGYISSNDGYVSDEYRSDRYWESWNDRKYAKGEPDMATFSVSGDNGSINGEDGDSIEDFYPNIRSLPPRRHDHRPGMYKCVSFDDSRVRMADDASTNVSKDKSPTRKISTISESAMTYLTVPQAGFMTTTTAYETVNDLSEVGHPHRSSQFFIGSYPRQSHDISRGSDEFGMHFESSARRSSIDKIKETTVTETANNESNEKIHVTKASLKFEKEQTKPMDDYIFPIVRKANKKILQERRNKKLASNNSSSDENVIGVAENLYRHHNTSTSDSHNTEPEMIVNEALPLHIRNASDASLTSPSRRISHTSNIPTIVLTKEKEDETIAATGRPVFHLAEVKPPRVRRLARANNPFLIEVDSPAVSEKVRRSSAPSMSRRTEPTPGAGSGDGMIRSASNDHLSRCNRDAYPRRPWSSEFFDLVINSDDYSKDGRFKKMIDDRYDALFNNKYPHLSVSSSYEGLKFQQDLSPRLWKLLASASHTSLTRDGQGDAGDANSIDIGDTEVTAELSSILDISKSKQLHQFNSETDRLNLESRSHSHSSESQLEIPRNNETSADSGRELRSNKYVTHTTAEHETVKAKLVYIRESHSPRPNLAPGTDGIDNGADMLERNASQNWPRSTVTKVHNTEKSLNVEDLNSIENKNNLKHTKTYWESFEDDLEVERLCVVNKPISEEAFTPENSNNPHNLPATSSELPSQETPNTIVVSHKDSLRQQYSEVAETIGTGENVNDLDLAKKSAHSQIDTPFSGQPKLTYDSEGSVLRKISSSSQNNQETFEDDFSMHITSIKQQTQEMSPTISHSQTISGLLHNAEDSKQHKQTTETYPQIPPRKARRRAPNIPKQTRPPSPFLSSQKTDSQSTTLQNKCDPLENDTNNAEVIADIETNNFDSNFHSRHSLVNKRIHTAETPPAAPTMGRTQQRSFSVSENSGTLMSRPQRAISVETDQPSAHLTYFNNWSHFFNKSEPRFLSSANNTLLQHNTSQDNLHDSVCLSDTEPENYLEPTVSPSSLHTQKKEQNRLKAMLLDDDDDIGARISSV